MKTPAILIAAPGSGSGKTMISCGLMASFLKRGKKVVSCKCGPDYIDPMFHREVVGVDSQNLDLFFYEKERLKSLYAAHAAGADLAVAEGVMGYYDGMGVDTGRASSYDVAGTLGLPVILIVPAKGAALSLAAVVRGMIEFMPDSNIRGILLNRVSGMLYPKLKTMLEAELLKAGHHNVKVVGYVPEHEAFAMGSRHLGLVTPQEIEGLKEQLDRAGSVLAETVDLDSLYAIAESAEELPDLPEQAEAARRERIAGRERAAGQEEIAGQKGSAGQEHIAGREVLIGVARDAAFCFYYKENLELLKKLGARPVFFSPLADEKLPEGIGGILLGGGYPELYAERLSKNRELLLEIREKLGQGMPCHAECGGFLYLHEGLRDPDGVRWEMAGVIPGEAYPQGKLVRFGYITVRGETDGAFLKKGETIRGHEFHYWDSTDNGRDARAFKPDGKRSWECVHMKNSLFAGFPHLAYPSEPAFAERFVKAAAWWQENGEKGAYAPE